MLYAPCSKLKSRLSKMSMLWASLFLVFAVGCSDAEDNQRKPGSSRVPRPSPQDPSLCTPACTEDQVCQNNACVPKQDLSVCEPACPKGRICKNKQCVNKDPLTKNCPEGCPRGQVCKNHECVERVLPGQCQPACTAPKVCENSVCVDPPPPECSDSMPCQGQYLACDQGQCIYPFTADCHPACGDGYECYLHECRQFDDTHCLPDCASGSVCQKGQCVVETGNECDPGDLCRFEDACIEGRCTTLGESACTSSCQSTETCVAGTCEAKDPSCTLFDVNETFAFANGVSYYRMIDFSQITATSNFFKQTCDADNEGTPADENKVYVFKIESTDYAILNVKFIQGTSASVGVLTSCSDEEKVGYCYGSEGEPMPLYPGANYIVVRASESETEKVKVGFEAKVLTTQPPCSWGSSVCENEKLKACEFDFRESANAYTTWEARECQASETCQVDSSGKAECS